MTLDIAAIRSQFPALGLEDGGIRRTYLDNPAGTQVPRSVVEAMSHCLIEANANLGGPFSSSEAAGQIVDAAHAAMADLLNAHDPGEIVFGANMTTLTFQLSRALGQQLEPGDEIIVSELDHDANVTPWVLVARDHGLVIRKIRLNPSTFQLDLEHFRSLLNARTRLVCVGHASNLLGTINNIDRIVSATREYDARVFVDAVHSTPHIPVDVQQLGCDFLVCSPYKFFGPHQGVLWGRRELLQHLPAYKLRPAPESLPGRFETGTQSHEAMAGVHAAVEYLAGLAPSTGRSSRRHRLHAGLQLVRDYEQQLCQLLLEGLAQIPGLSIFGITADLDKRTPTVSFRVEGVAPDLLARELGQRNIFSWAGHSYAVEPCRALGVLDSGGVLRVGLAHYNHGDDVQTLLGALAEITEQARFRPSA